MWSELHRAAVRRDVGMGDGAPGRQSNNSECPRARAKLDNSSGGWDNRPEDFDRMQTLRS